MAIVNDLSIISSGSGPAPVLSVSRLIAVCIILLPMVAAWATMSNPLLTASWSMDGCCAGAAFSLQAMSISLVVALSRLPASVFIAWISAMFFSSFLFGYSWVSQELDSLGSLAGNP